MDPSIGSIGRSDSSRGVARVHNDGFHGSDSAACGNSARDEVVRFGCDCTCGLRGLVAQMFPPTKRRHEGASSETACASSEAVGEAAVDLFGDTGARAGDDANGDATLSHRQKKKQVIRDARQERKGQKKIQKQADALNAALESVDQALAEMLSISPESASAASVVQVAAPAQSRGNASYETGDGRVGGPGRGGGKGKRSGKRYEHEAVSDGNPERDERLRDRLSKVFKVQGSLPRYSRLPLAHGPSLTAGYATVKSVILRPPKYTEKFLPQEYSLLHKIWTLLDGANGGCSGAGVVDIGAGNANCAVLAAVLLGLTVICVERESPRIELRAEAQLPEGLRDRVLRVESDIEDFDARALETVAANHGLSRVVLVAKHPCGIGVDRSIDCAAKLLERDSASRGRVDDKVAVVGVVLATCCTNKLSMDDLRVPRSSEFCRFYADDLLGGDCCGGVDGRRGNSTPLPQSAESSAAPPPPPLPLERAVEVMSRSSSWRSASGSDGNAILDGQVAWAEFFEDALQSLRLRRLRRLFGAACEVRFAPRACTMQDRCLIGAPPADLRRNGIDLGAEVATAEESLAAVAGDRHLFPQKLFLHDGEDAAFAAQLQRSSTELLAMNDGPIDCRPRGLKSARYEFDNTGADDLEPPAD
eukprot:TRINITY_DN27325_c0_g1_i1.p1 TRINITY_DN27325_c0_g1~~TRINITY_DN27325_c0_g1_i1.p1  ORF type:complete len:667 (+),score=136.26 TRINITY_DN27325_c0_g1_i1:61-2001(+)